MTRLDLALAVHALTTASTTELVAALENLVARTKALNAVGLEDALSVAATQLLAEVTSEWDAALARGVTAERERDEARREAVEIAALAQDGDDEIANLRRVAADYGWSYLYMTPEEWVHGS